MNDEGTVISEANGLKLVKFKSFDKYENEVKHCFTARCGGVSTGECKSLNLGLKRKDTRANVEQNFRLVCEAAGMDYNGLVFSDQVHDNRILAVNEADKGKGLHRASDIEEYDGLVTDCKGVVLVTFYADCVPVFLYDKAKKVIGLAHSGWKGTVGKIAGVAVKKMIEAYGSKPEDILAGIGPSIQKCCFEVGNEVMEEFTKAFPQENGYFSKGEDRYYISLSGIIKRTLIIEGIPEENISATGHCTKCEAELFFSHRRDEGKTGSMAALMELV